MAPSSDFCTLVLAPTLEDATRAGYTTGPSYLVATPLNAHKAGRPGNDCNRLIIIGNVSLLSHQYKALRPVFMHAPNQQHLLAKLGNRVGWPRD